MAFEVPQFSPDLMDALKRPMQPPSPMMQPGMPGGPPMTNGMPVGGARMPIVPFRAATPSMTPMGMPQGMDSVTAPHGDATIPSATGAKVAAPTDDPAVLGQVPKPPNLMSYLDPAMTRYNTDFTGYQKADEGSRIDPQAVKPRLWERLVGGLLGGLSGVGGGTGEAGQQFTNRRLLNAERDRGITMAPWTKRLQEDKEAIPAAQAAASTAHNQATLDLDTHNSQREDFTAKENAKSKDEVNAIRKMYDEGRIADAQKALDETSEKNKNNLEMSRQLLEIRQQLADARDRANDIRDKKADKDKDHTAQSQGAETQKSNSLKTAHAAYVKATQGLPTDPKAEWTEEQLGQLKQAKDALSESEQEAEDAYEAKSSELGGASVPHQDVTKDWGQGKTGDIPGKSEVPAQAGPAGENPLKTATDGQGKKIGYYKSTGQWMLLSQEKK